MTGMGPARWVLTRAVTLELWEFILGLTFVVFIFLLTALLNRRGEKPHLVLYDNRSVFRASYPLMTSCLCLSASVHHGCTNHSVRTGVHCQINSRLLLAAWLLAPIWTSTKVDQALFYLALSSSVPFTLLSAVVATQIVDWDSVALVRHMQCLLSMIAGNLILTSVHWCVFALIRLREWKRVHESYAVLGLASLIKSAYLIASCVIRKSFWVEVHHFIFRFRYGHRDQLLSYLRSVSFASLGHHICALGSERWCFFDFFRYRVHVDHVNHLLLSGILRWHYTGPNRRKSVDDLQSIYFLVWSALQLSFHWLNLARVDEGLIDSVFIDSASSAHDAFFFFADNWLEVNFLRYHFGKKSTRCLLLEATTLWRLHYRCWTFDIVVVSLLNCWWLA